MDFSINLYERPARSGNSIILKINQIISSSTGSWFTEDVVEDTQKDLIFQDLFCIERNDGQVLSFLIIRVQKAQFL